jgi:ABC-type dipeptide/oligopeptide/nickel transport system permease subunit
MRHNIMRTIAAAWLLTAFILPTAKAAEILNCAWWLAFAPLACMVLFVLLLVVLSLLTGDDDDGESGVEP